MKKVLALVMVVLLLATVTPIALASGATVYVSVSVDGKLEVAAQPITADAPTVDAVLKAVHSEHYSGGESGYKSSIDPTWNMFLISQCWGIASTPYVIVNGAPIGANPTDPTADAYPVKAGDNIVISVSSDPAVPAQAVSLTTDVSGDSATVNAQNWILDFATFQYSASPLAGATVIDPITGASLGTTDADGNITVPADGIVAIDGLAAIPADGSSASTSDSASAPADPAAPSAPAAAPGDDVTVYVSVSVDGILHIAAQPVTVNIATVETALKAAHAAYYSGGESGFAAGIDSTYFMYMINTFWGVPTVPYIVLNNAPLGSEENAAYISADVAPINEGDNISVLVSSTGVTYPVVSMKIDEDNVLSARSWALDFQTFQYNDAPLAEYDIIDAQTGEVLATTDALGKAKIKKLPDCGVVAVTGLAALPVGEVKTFTAYDGVYVPPEHDYSVFGGPDGRSLLILVVVGLGLAIPLFIVVLYAQRKELKGRGVKFSGLGHKNNFP